MRKMRGFTLVEMLIVIAIIGVLAVAVLSAINPVEQMRKARDTRRKSNAAELLNAVERYYTTNETYGTAYTVGAGNDCTTAIANQVVAADLADLTATNELKAEFVNRIGTADNYLYSAVDATSELVLVCFQIESATNIAKYTGAPNYCTDAGGDSFVCLPE